MYIMMLVWWLAAASHQHDECATVDMWRLHWLCVLNTDGYTG